MRLTRERAKELLPIIQAFTEGKTIQWKDALGRWLDFSNEDAEVNFNDSPSHYRIKTEPKYRPFRTQEECWNEMHKHPDFGWLKSKYNGNVALIGTLYKKDEVLMIVWATNEYSRFSSSNVFDEYVFTDGKPFGIKEE